MQTQKKTASSAERVRKHRERKKAGAQLYKLTVTPEQMEKAKLLTRSNRDRTPEEILQLMLDASFARFDFAKAQLEKAVELGATDEEIQAYTADETERLMPKTIEKFLEEYRKKNNG